MSLPSPTCIVSTSSIDTRAPVLSCFPLQMMPYTQSFSPGMYCGGPSLKPMARSLTAASRYELLSITSGSAIVGVLVALMVTKMMRPGFTFSPATIDCSSTQLGGSDFT